MMTMAVSFVCYTRQTQLLTDLDTLHSFISPTHLSSGTHVLLSYSYINSTSSQLLHYGQTVVDLNSIYLGFIKPSLDSILIPSGIMALKNPYTFLPWYQQFPKHPVRLLLKL